MERRIKIVKAKEALQKIISLYKLVKYQTQEENGLVLHFEHCIVVLII
jgi:hypothetical protein